MECEFTDCDRYQSDRHGMKGAFIYELSYPKQARKETLEGGYTDTLDTYIAWIAQEMGDDEEMLPIIQDFMNEIMNITSDEVIKENGRYTWKIINDISGYWYISLSGIIIYTGRHQIEKEITKARQLLDIMDEGDICKFSNWKFKRIHNRIVFVK